MGLIVLGTLGFGILASRPNGSKSGSGDDFGFGETSSSSSSNSKSKNCTPKDPKKPNCRIASDLHLEKIGIIGRNAEHAYKKGRGVEPVGHFDICECDDGLTRIAPVNKCGKTDDFWECE